MFFTPVDMGDQSTINQTDPFTFVRILSRGFGAKPRNAKWERKDLMSIPDGQFFVSARSVWRWLALACVASVLLAPSAKAGTSTILAFSQLNQDDVVVATRTGTSTTITTTSAMNSDGGGTSIPVYISTYLGQPQIPFPLLAYETINVTSSGAATNSMGTISQDYSGTITFTANPGAPSGGNPAYLIVTFGSNGVFSGGAGGGSASLNASEPTDTVTFTVPYNPSIPGSGLSYTEAAASLSFSNITPVLGITDTTIASFTAQDSGTFSAAIVPEPGTLCLSSFAIVIGGLTYWKKRKARSK